MSQIPERLVQDPNHIRLVQLESHFGTDEHLADMMVTYFSAGKLNCDEWKNVVDHCLTVASSAETLATLLRLHPDRIQEIVKVALVHDWDKRVEKRPEDFSSGELKEIERLSGQLDLGLLRMTKYAHEEVLYDLEALSLDQMIVYYADNTAMGDKVVSIEKRINDAATRNDIDPYLVRLAVDSVENELFYRLGGENRLECPGDLPEHLDTMNKARVLK